MPAGLSARQLSGVCQSIGSTKDYLGSFMCSHNWQYPSRTYYTVHPATLSNLHMFINTQRNAAMPSLGLVISSQKQQGLKFDFNLLLLHCHCFSSLLT